MKEFTCTALKALEGYYHSSPKKSSLMIDEQLISG